MKLKEIIHIIESVAPLSWQEPWDNSGLQVGDQEADVSKVMLCTDVTPNVVRQAIEEGCHLILSHHPLLFDPLRHIIGQTWQEEVVREAIRHDISIYASHTPMDQYEYGISYHMAKQWGITDTRILHPTHGDQIGYGVVGRLGQRTIALCGGAGTDFMDDAIRQGADVYITSEWKHHQLLNAYHHGIQPIIISHGEAEQVITTIYKQLLCETNLVLCEASAEPIPSPKSVSAHQALQDVIN